MNTKKVMLGKFDMNGLSSKINHFKFCFQEMRIRYDNGQNIMYSGFILVKLLTIIEIKFLNEKFNNRKNKFLFNVLLPIFILVGSLVLNLSIILVGILFLLDIF